LETNADENINRLITKMKWAVRINDAYRERSLIRTLKILVCVIMSFS